MEQPGRFLALIGAGLLVLVVLTTVVVLLAERRGPPSYPPGSPEATVVAYVEAIQRNDPEQVRALLSSRTRTELERREQEPFYDFSSELTSASEGLRTARVRIVRVEQSNGRARVTLTVERSSADLKPGFPLPNVDGGTYSYQQTLDLVQEGGEWKIDRLIFYL